ncbi:MAG: hypothetical protein J5698_04180 [Bacteroidaceae bacterium]|nr:hypothetical protein [Bacteroidaceae bacterium]
MDMNNLDKTTAFRLLRVAKLALAIVIIGTVVTSCYKIIRTYAPTEVTGTETFEARLVVTDDGSSTQNFTTDWSVAAVRVPDGWTVTIPRGGHRQYAEDWVYYSDGSKVSSRQNMSYNAHLSDLYNAGAPLQGYKWWAFVTDRMVPKHMASCWRNGCDSIAITFQITPNGVPGTYHIDFIAGDEEAEEGVEKYSSFSAASSTRLIHAATISTFSGGKKPDNAAPGLSRTIVVKEASGIRATDSAEELSRQNPDAVYSIDGCLLRNGTSTEGLAPGVYIIGGEKKTVR